MGKKFFIRFALYFFIALAASSCKILSPSMMLRAPINYQYTPLPDTFSIQYRISKSDQIQMRLFANDGFRMVDVTGETQGGGTSSSSTQRQLHYLVEFDGTAKFPILGRIPVAGLTIRDCELMLRDKYAEYFHSPFLMLSVQNRRVFLFPGTDGDAKVIPLEYDNTTLIEALALGGGISSNGKAHKIKIIRGNPANPEVYIIDLSKINGVKRARMVLQANDIIYIVPRYRTISRVLSEITPYLSLFSTALLIYTLTQKF